MGILEGACSPDDTSSFVLRCRAGERFYCTDAAWVVATTNQQDDFTARSAGFADSVGCDFEGWLTFEALIRSNGGQRRSHNGAG